MQLHCSMIDGANGHATNTLSTPFIDQMGRYILNAHICGNNYIDYGDAHVHAGPVRGAYNSIVFRSEREIAAKPFTS